MKSKGLSFNEIPTWVRAKFWSRVLVGPKSKCWEWSGTKRTKQGYGQIGFGGRYPMSHVVAFVLTKEDVPPGLCVLHRCDNPRCCNPDHLFCGTYEDNNRDRESKGRGANKKGILNGRSVLNEQQVSEIRAQAKPYQMTYKMLAKKYCVSEVLICKIVTRQLWKHIP